MFHVKQNINNVYNDNIIISSGDITALVSDRIGVFVQPWPSPPRHSLKLCWSEQLACAAMELSVHY
jgi:hypothetical protein